MLRNVRLLEAALADLAAGRPPEVPGPVTTRDDGQVVARVFPRDAADRLLFPGVTAEVWMEPGVGRHDLARHQAAAYREAGSAAAPGRIALVLGGGNVTSIGPMDALHRLFADKHLVLYKVHPLQEPLTAAFEEAFGAFVERGFLRVVSGGGEVGAYLAAHPEVDEVHLTGSDRTYEAIVFGAGAEGRANRAAGRRALAKPVTAELGNVSPVVVVPGPWGPGDLAYQAENVASMLTNNAGFNCNAARVIVTHRGWGRREDFLAALRRRLAAAPTRPAWYPGAADRCGAVLAGHPEAERFGRPADGHLPWVLVSDLDPEAADEGLFREEAFCSVFAETALEAPSAARFVERAVRFCNERLWGTLNVTLLVHPDSLRDPATADALDRAVAELRYGTVAINHWAAVAYATAATPWGSFPGNPAEEIQSGAGWVHNPYLFDRPQKSVLRAPFRARPKPPWFLSHRTADGVNRALTAWEGTRSPLALPALAWHALRG
ncbi:MAG TPA: aldehyde dehydrogenase family protein [Thermoanaerobaculia bacterium]|nr:aldehyde dehydrogenase family protein [Thermoanaerobaculia bacterium]